MTAVAAAVVPAKRRIAIWLLLISLLATTLAEKDSNYYGEGVSNPNTKHDIYWRDASNVLDDLSSFEALYVRYHSCAWSPYSYGCGQDGGNEDATWYQGYTDCYRANVGYSLYGVLKGSSDSGCNRNTYINSFFTTTGVETFTSAMQSVGRSFSGTDDEDGYAGGVSSVCTVSGDNDGNENGDDSYAQHNEKQYADSTSSGVGCYGKRFVQKTFQGAYCDAQEETDITNYLMTFNDELSNLNCVTIYDASSSNNNEDGDNGDGDGDEEDGDGDEQEEEQEQDIDYENGLALLSYSEACSIREYPKACPDPHGKLHSYTTALERATGTNNSSNQAGNVAKTVISWILLILGIIFIVLGCMADFVRRRRRRRALKKVRRQEKTVGWKLKNVFKLRRSNTEKSNRSFRTKS